MEKWCRSVGRGGFVCGFVCVIGEVDQQSTMQSALIENLSPVPSTTSGGSQLPNFSIVDLYEILKKGEGLNKMVVRNSRKILTDSSHCHSVCCLLFSLLLLDT